LYKKVIFFFYWNVNKGDKKVHLHIYSPSVS